MALIGNEIQELLGDKKWVAMPIEHYKAICDTLREKTSTSAMIVSGELAKKIASLAGVDVSMVTATAEDVLTGTKFVDSTGETVEGSMPNNGTVNYTISTKAGTVAPAKGYHSGSGKVSISTAEQNKIIASNILKGITMLGVAGSTETFSEYTGTWTRSSSRKFGVVTPSKATYAFAFPYSYDASGSADSFTLIIDGRQYYYSIYSSAPQTYSSTIQYTSGYSYMSVSSAYDSSNNFTYDCTYFI